MSFRGAPARNASAMPSPVLMFALVVNGNTRPHPPVHRITASARIVSMRPVANSIATRPHTLPSSTSSVVANHSS
ncbi:Uncharacterised protein [Mycobacterium tuberculosis]|nr:Uncharacterised protein [Mycobacterium tuberculosis]